MASKVSSPCSKSSAENARNPCATDFRAAPRENLRTIPLAYRVPTEATQFERSYPQQFSAERRLRVLFLGQVNLRKGATELLAAARELVSEPIEFWLVGPMQLNVAAPDRESANVRFVGSVSRECHRPPPRLS